MTVPSFEGNLFAAPDPQAAAAKPSEKSDAELARFLKMRLDEFKKLPALEQTKFIQLYVNELVKNLPKEKADAVRFDFGPVLTPGMAALNGGMRAIQEEADAGRVDIHKLSPAKVVKMALLEVYPELASCLTVPVSQTSQSSTPQRATKASRGCLVLAK